ncbi:SHOCT domain-containing protein [Halorientalis pallida]|uniref:SHOCT domain-containing protein n=1 Tax=Halorientalis pallida TaxID=2479928 RepID=A0A498L3D0_9EURY|nr:SHOCT domain-containing protein [Halorientalis pallida]RXK51134.1 SHOCT domain-containing protein [Halorientalis pallida]
MVRNNADSQLLRIGLLIVVALVVVPVLFMGFGMMGGGYMMDGMWRNGWAGGAAPAWLWIVALALRLLFLLVIVGAVYLLYRSLSGSGDEADRALEELRLAYARGELSDDEYERRRETLERDR